MSLLWILPLLPGCPLTLRCSSPSSPLPSSPLCSLRSCCQEAAEALISPSLVRYAEQTPQTRPLLCLSAFSHAPSRQRRLTCLSSQLSVKKAKEKVEPSPLSFLAAWRIHKVTAAKRSASSPQILSVRAHHHWCTALLTKKAQKGYSPQLQVFLSVCLTDWTNTISDTLKQKR